LRLLRMLLDLPQEIFESYARLRRRPNETQGERRLRISVLPVGAVDEENLEYIRRALQKAFPEASISSSREAMPLPTEAYNTIRDQYDSNGILSKLRLLPKSEAGRLLGVTEADLYVPSMNFIFGQAHNLSGIAVISTRRLRPEFYAQPPDRQLFLERCAKEAIHEIGHTHGLDHCVNPACVMYFSNSIKDTDRKTSSFCRNCHAKALEALKSSSSSRPNG